MPQRTSNSLTGTYIVPFDIYGACPSENGAVMPTAPSMLVTAKYSSSPTVISVCISPLSRTAALPFQVTVKPSASAVALKGVIRQAFTLVSFPSLYMEYTPSKAVASVVCCEISGVSFVTIASVSAAQVVKAVVPTKIIDKTGTINFFIIKTFLSDTIIN